MEFHPLKSNVLSISRKAKPIDLQYSLHGQDLKYVQRAKYLRCLNTSDLQWSDHISNIMGKVNKTLGFLRRKLSTIKKKCIQIISQALTLSPVWYPYILFQKDKHPGIGPNTFRTLCQQQANNRSSVDKMIQHGSHLSNVGVWQEKVAINANACLTPPLRRTRHSHQFSYQMPTLRVTITNTHFPPNHHKRVE